MGETVEVVRERERQFREQSSSKKRCHNSILCKHAELLDSLERERERERLANETKKQAKKVAIKQIKNEEIINSKKSL